MGSGVVKVSRVDMYLEGQPAGDAFELDVEETYVKSNAMIFLSENWNDSVAICWDGKVWE